MGWRNDVRAQYVFSKSTQRTFSNIRWHNSHCRQHGADQSRAFQGAGFVVGLSIARRTAWHVCMLGVRYFDGF